MKCFFCKSDIEHIRKDVKIVNRKGDFFIIKNVPVMFCLSCVQEFYDKPVADLLDDIQSGKVYLKKKVVEWGELHG